MRVGTFIQSMDVCDISADAKQLVSPETQQLRGTREVRMRIHDSSISVSDGGQVHMHAMTLLNGMWDALIQESYKVVSTQQTNWPPLAPAGPSAHPCETPVFLRWLIHVPVLRSSHSL